MPLEPGGSGRNSELAQRESGATTRRVGSSLSVPVPGCGYTTGAARASSAQLLTLPAAIVSAAAARPGFGTTVAVARGEPPPSGVAHSEQNFAVGRFAAPQLGQTDANGVAHSMQNFAPARFSVPQFEQITPISSARPSPSSPENSRMVSRRGRWPHRERSPGASWPSRRTRPGQRSRVGSVR